jgi:hypothetical protein
MIESCSLIKEEEKNFFDQLIKFLFAAVKRRFNFSHVTAKIYQHFINKNSMIIWKGGDFT